MVVPVGFEPTVPEGGRFTVCYVYQLTRRDHHTNYGTYDLSSPQCLGPIFCEVVHSSVRILY